MSTGTKRFLSALLSLIMLICVFPTLTFADDPYEAVIEEYPDEDIYAVIEDADDTVEDYSEDTEDAPPIDAALDYMDGDSLALDCTELTLSVGQEYTFEATVMPAGTPCTDAVWSSSDEAIAAVDENGTVTALSNGTVTITVTAGELAAECLVSVVTPSTRIKLSATSVKLKPKATKTLTATLTPSDSTDKVKWKSSDTAVAKVSTSGKITAVAPGTATITATATSGKTATCEVIVYIPATKIVLSATTASLKPTKTKTLTATLTPADTTDTVTWTSSATKVAKVSKSGKITAVAPGTATITATTTSGKTATCEVTVVKVKSTKVVLNKTSLSVNDGSSAALTATMTPSYSTDKLTWSSSDTSIATVSKGTVKAVSPGTCTITVKTTSGKTASCKVTVKFYKKYTGQGYTSEQQTASFTLKSKVELTYKFKVKFLDADSTRAGISLYNADSSSVYIAYDSLYDDGTATRTITLDPGTYYFGVGGYTSKAGYDYTITMTGTIIPSLSKDSLYMLKGKTTTLKVLGTKESYKWSSTNTSVATVSSTGKVTAVGYGTATIKATLASGKVLKCVIDVVAPVVAEVYKYEDHSPYDYCYVTFKNITDKDVTYVAFKINQYDSNGNKLTSPADLYYINNTISPGYYKNYYFEVNKNTAKATVTITSVKYSDGTSWTR